MKKSSNDNLVLGLDIGKTKVAAGIVDVKSKNIVKKILKNYKSIDKDSILTTVMECISEALNLYNVLDVGIGCFGRVDQDNGVLLESAAMPDWKNVPIIKLLKDKFGFRSVFLANDAIAAVAGEYCYKYFGNDIVVLTVGTSIGMGAIVDNKILVGKHNLSGQIAHLNFTDSEYTLSQLAGGKGITERMFEQTAIKATTAEIVELARTGRNLVARKIIETAAYSIANTLAIIQRIIDPNYMLLGGGVILNNEYFYERIIKKLNKIVLPFNSQNIANIVDKTSLGIYSGVFGGAVLCMNLVR